MAEKFYGNLGTPPKFTPITIDGSAKIAVSSLVGGFPGLTPKIDFDNVDMLVFVGTNPMVSHGHNNGMFNPAGPIRAAAARGDVWTIDPLFTETARAVLEERELPDIQATMARLGVQVVDGEARLDDEHPAAAIRRAIMAPRR